MLMQRWDNHILTYLEMLESGRNARDVQAEASRRAPRAVNARAEELVSGFPRVSARGAPQQPCNPHEREHRGAGRLRRQRD